MKHLKFRVCSFGLALLSGAMAVALFFGFMSLLPEVRTGDLFAIAPIVADPSLPDWSVQVAVVDVLASLAQLAQGLYAGAILLALVVLPVIVIVLLGIVSVCFHGCIRGHFSYAGFASHRSHRVRASVLLPSSTDRLPEATSTTFLAGQLGSTKVWLS